MSYEPTYWGHTGKYQKDYNRLYKKLVPDSGMAKTMEGELLRCISRFYYDKYNNGLCNFSPYWVEFVNEYRRMNNLSVKWSIGLHEKITEERLDTLIDNIIEHLLEIEKNGKINT